MVGVGVGGDGAGLAAAMAMAVRITVGCQDLRSPCRSVAVYRSKNGNSYFLEYYVRTVPVVGKGRPPGPPHVCMHASSFFLVSFSILAETTVAS